jgi:hypothetical protein
MAAAAVVDHLAERAVQVMVVGVTGIVRVLGWLV